MNNQKMNDSYLKCDLHDYLEIACVFKIEVMLTLRNGDEIVGVPTTTGIDRQSGEYLVVCLSSSKEQRAIPVMTLQSMRSIRPNVHFDNIDF